MNAKKITSLFITTLLLASTGAYANLGYNTWATNTFTSGSQISDGTANPTFDADGDGLANLVEYTFNLDPLDPNSNGPLIEIIATNGTATIQYNRRNDVASNQVELQFSNDLTTWRPAILGLDYNESEIATHADYKRIKVNLTGLTGGAAFVRSRVYLDPNTTTRPNIIMLFSDDQQDNSFGAMGHPWVQTPNVDKLINNGVHFSNTYIAEPTCAPSRVSLFMGMNERVNGVGFTSSYGIDEGMWSRSYPAVLKANGYHTGFIGKFGTEHYNFNAAEKFDYWLGHDGWAGFRRRYANEMIYTNIAPSVNATITDTMGLGMSDFLDNAPANKPFCLQVSFSAPHKSVTANIRAYAVTGLNDLPYNLPEDPLPASWDPKNQGFPNDNYSWMYRRAVGDHTPADYVINSVPAETGLPTTGVAYSHIPKSIMDQDRGRAGLYFWNYIQSYNEEHHVRYFQCISGIDRIIGELMDDLKARGLDQNTVILYCSDNGQVMGDYGMGGKMLMYDKAMKVPTFIYDPRAPQSARGQKVEALTTSLDLTSTILDLAGVQQPDVMQGQPLTPFLQGNTPTNWRDRLFIDSLCLVRGNPVGEGIRYGKWKYIRYYIGTGGWNPAMLRALDSTTPDFEQLFDLDADPEEMNNLLAQYEGTQLLTDLRNWCESDAQTMNQLRVDYENNYTVSTKRGIPDASAYFMASTPSTDSPLIIKLDASRSRAEGQYKDASNNVIMNTLTKYEWDFDADGSIDDTGIATTKTFPSAGTYQVRLIVTEEFNNSTSTNTMSLTVPLPATHALPPPSATQVSGEIDVTADSTSSTQSGYKPLIANTLSDQFAYNPASPKSPAPEQSNLDDLYLGEVGANNGDVELVYTIDVGLASITNGKKLFVDIYGRAGQDARSSNLTIELYNGGLAGTVVGSVSGVSTSGAPLHGRGEITPTAPFDTIKVIKPATAGVKTNLDLAEIRFSTDQ